MDYSFDKVNFTQDQKLDLIELQNSTGTPFTEQYFDWKYMDSENFILLAIDKQSKRLAGHYAVINWPIWNGQEQLLCVQSVDTIVHPDFRRKGIFGILGHECLMIARDSGKKFAFGFTAYGRPAYSGFIENIGWKDAGLVPEMAYSLKPYASTRLALKNKFLSFIAGTLLSLRGWVKKPKKLSGDYEIKQEWNDSAFFKCLIDGIHKEMITSYRDAEFFNHRFRIHPNQKYVPLLIMESQETLAYVILTENNGFGYIVDFQSLKYGKHLVELFSAALKYFEQLKTVHSVLIRFTEDAQIRKILNSIGFIRRKAQQALIFFQLDEQLQNSERYIHLKNYFISYTESDHI